MKKIKLLFLPFLLSVIGLSVSYTFLNWLFIIKLQLFPVKEGVINFGIPIILPILPYFLWLRPRLNLLDIKRGKNELGSLYPLFLWVALVLPTQIAQSYIVTAAGQLTQLDHINLIEKQEQTKYYQLKKFYIDKSHTGTYPSFDVSNKGRNLNMHFYVILPILGSAADTSSSSCSAWMGIEYNKEISNNLDKKEEDLAFQEFVDECFAEFQSKDVNQFVYLEKVGNSEDLDNFKEAIKKCPEYNSNNAPIFLGINEPFENRNGDSVLWFFATLGICSFIWLLMISIPKFNIEELAQFESGKSKGNTELIKILNFLKPKEGFFITPILIYLNIAVYIIMVFSGLGPIFFSQQDLLNWGANFGPMTTNGEWWRLLTCSFLQGGLLHLFFNMIPGLGLLGLFIEPFIGRAKYLFVYLLTGVLASCASLWWNEATVSIGASGAISGLYGFSLVLFLTKVFPLSLGKTLLFSAFMFINICALIALTEGLDYANVIGGLASGFVIGLLLHATIKEQIVSPNLTDSK